MIKANKFIAFKWKLYPVSNRKLKEWFLFSLPEILLHCINSLKIFKTLKILKLPNRSASADFYIDMISYKKESLSSFLKHVKKIFMAHFMTASFMTP